MTLRQLLRDTLTVFVTRDPEEARDRALDLVSWWEDTLGCLLWKSMHPELPLDEPHPKATDVFGWDIGTLCSDRWARYALRFHDAAHIELGYDTSAAGEGELACYLLANGVYDPGYLPVVLYSLKEGTPPGQLLKAAKRGKEAPFAPDWILWRALSGSYHYPGGLHGENRTRRLRGRPRRHQSPLETRHCGTRYL